MKMAKKKNRLALYVGKNRMQAVDRKQKINLEWSSTMPLTLLKKHNREAILSIMPVVERRR